MKTLIFVDLDGTLLDSNNKISKKNKEVITKAKNLGYTIILSTGKSYLNARPYYDELGLDSYLVTSHGQFIHDKDENIIYSSSISKKVWDTSFEKLKNSIKCFYLETTEGVYSNCSECKFLSFISKKEIKEEQVNEIIGMYLSFDDEIEIDIDGIRALPWETGDKEFTYSLKPKGISKEAALKWIIDKEKFEYVIGFGNGRSDINALKIADLPFAMKNSHEAVLEEFDSLTEFDNDNDGVAIEIEKIIRKEQ